MFCKDNKDGSCSVEYVPFTPGDYDVNITYGGQPIPGKTSVTCFSALFYWYYILFQVTKIPFQVYSSTAALFL